MPDPIQQVQSALDGAHAMIASASADALSKQTPCAEWDGRGLVDHMIGVVKNFGTAFGGGQLTPATPGQGGTDDLAGTYRQAADTLLAAIREPGALDKTIKLPFGEMAAGQALGIVIGDQTIHTWDLAKTTGQSFTMNEETAAAILAALHQLITPERRGPGKGFAAEVPCAADAPVQDRLLAFSGRQP